MDQPEAGQPATSLPVMLLDILPLAMRVLSAEMRDTRHQLTNAHLPVLAILEIAPRTQRELADVMSVRGATMSNTLTTLEDRGWVTRTRMHDDRRLVHIQITAMGRTVLQESKAEMIGYLKSLLQHLPEDEQHRLADGLLILRRLFMTALAEQTEQRSVE